ncbi:hypothetical protein [Virgibacillus senegalensis]|uniref:hypothetical protein n=1 Tax=Virgibacillus senegalensis TaxID=1499679 RepID=UPI00069DC6AC|nr:hypothetical protein [Virgibacillus senegalensis]
MATLHITAANHGTTITDHTMVILIGIIQVTITLGMVTRDMVSLVRVVIQGMEEDSQATVTAHIANTITTTSTNPK